MFLKDTLTISFKGKFKTAQRLKVILGNFSGVFYFFNLKYSPPSLVYVLNTLADFSPPKKACNGFMAVIKMNSNDDPRLSDEDCPSTF